MSSLSKPLPAPSTPQAQGSYYDVQPGENLWRIARDFGLDARDLARANRLADPTQVKSGQRLFIPPPSASTRFLWPARGRVAATPSRGLQINAPESSLVRASRTGRVAVATQQLAGWGKTVIIDHGDGYVSVYAGLEQLLVSPGTSVQQGNPVGRLGAGPLYFEIRRGTTLQNPLPLLP